MSELAKQLATLMVAKASDFVGLTEVKSNAVWDDLSTEAWEKEKSDWLRLRMADVKGWSPGAPYCAAFDGAIAAACLNALRVDPTPFLQKWTAHCMTNVNMLRSLGLLSFSPSVGALWLAQFGKTSSGHAGIVAVAGSRYQTTIEANTVPQVNKNELAQRAGNGIWLRTFAVTGRGKLATRGYASAEAILKLANYKG